MRSPERAEAASGERAAALARELVEQLGRMRGAAMKIGQVLHRRLHGNPQGELDAAFWGDRRPLARAA